jgi:hypothetical protein
MSMFRPLSAEGPAAEVKQPWQAQEVATSRDGSKAWESGIDQAGGRPGALGMMCKFIIVLAWVNRKLFRLGAG